jgi:mono/diheme cytochrome c family protein
LFQDQEWVNDARNRLRDDLKKSGLDDQAVNAKIAGMSNSHEQRGPARANLLALPNDKYQRLADPYDRTATLEGRAKSYLHSNCAICHIEAGGGNSQMQLEFTTALDKMKIIDIVPHHDKFGIPDARIIAPGHPERSVLLKRILTRGRGQMPQLATTQIDQAAVEMFTEWINQLQEAK